MGKKKEKSFAGRSLIKDRFGGKGKHSGGESFLHTSELNDGYEWGRLNLQSVTEQNTLDDFLATAELAGTEFTAEKLNIVVVDPSKHSGLPSQEELEEVKEVQQQHRQLLSIPRRPPWDDTTTPEQLDRKERDSFLAWRRQLAELQEVEHIVLTPFEKNLEFWRQLWRVIERSDVVIQIVDARNPLLFRCPDLEKYVKEVGAEKTNMILMNKADHLTQQQRQYWADYFAEEGIKIAFWSATEETKRLQEERKDHEPEEGEHEEEQNEESDSEDTDEDDTEEGQSENTAVLDRLGQTGDSSASVPSRVPDNENPLEPTSSASNYGPNVDPHGAHSRNTNAHEKQQDYTVTLQQNMQKVTLNVQESATEAPVCSKPSTNISDSSHEEDCSCDTDKGPAHGTFNNTKLLDGSELVQLMKTVHRGKQVNADYVTVGMVGYPNVGKSSTINALMQTKKVPVSATPGRTKHFQTLFLDPELLLCDCPGLVMPTFVSTKAEMVINGILPIDQMRDYVPPVSLVCRHIPRALLESTYGILLPQPQEGEDPDRPPTAHEFLAAYGYMRGYMTHKGIPDYQRSARYVLKDYVNGKLLYCHPPPGINEEDFKPTPEPKHHLPSKPQECTLTDKPGSGKPQFSNEVDRSFFEKTESRVGTRGVTGVMGYTRKEGFTSHRSQGQGDGTSSMASSSSSLNAKPWKKHQNIKKKEKLRRLHRDMNA